MNNNFLSDLKSKISIVDVIGSYIKLSKKGNNYLGVCPFHGDTNPSLTVNEKKKMYKCFACGNGGDVFNFIKQFESINYQKAILKACEICNIDLNKYQGVSSFIKTKNNNEVFYEINELACNYFRMFLDNKENHHVVEYLNKRGLTQEICNQFKIGFSPKDSKLMIDLLTNKDDIVLGAKKFTCEQLIEAGIASVTNNGNVECFFYNRIMFPIFNEFNELVAFSGRTLNPQDDIKYLNTTNTRIFNKGQILFNLNQVIQKNIDTESLYIVEGFMDAIAATKIGINHVVATMGVAFSYEHLNSLKNLISLKSIILCFDNDDAGSKATIKTAELLKPYYDIYIVDYQQVKYKDIDEMVNHDQTLAISVMNNLIDYDSFIINNLIKETNINNVADKNNLIKKIVSIMKSIKNELILETNIIFVAKELDIDQQIIINMLDKTSNFKPSRKFNSQKKKTNSLDLVLTENKNQKTWTLKDDPLTLIEREILKFCLVNRDWAFYFQSKKTFVNDDLINHLIDMITAIYIQNSRLAKIDSIDIINEHSKLSDNEIYELCKAFKDLNSDLYTYNQLKLNNIIDVYHKNYIKQKRIELKKQYENQLIDAKAYWEILQKLNKY